MDHQRYKDFVDLGPCTNETPCGNCVDIMHERLECLAANLAIGAGLCEAFWNGYQRGASAATQDGRVTWVPGCHRPAPGWNKEEA